MHCYRTPGGIHPSSDRQSVQGVFWYCECRDFVFLPRHSGRSGMKSGQWCRPSFLIRNIRDSRSVSKIYSRIVHYEMPHQWHPRRIKLLQCCSVKMFHDSILICFGVTKLFLVWFMLISMTCLFLAPASTLVVINLNSTSAKPIAVYVPISSVSE